MVSGGEGREGDWECNGCKNRNYAFRSFCNRCKQPRLLVDSKTPADSKWLPRLGDWICSGCTNNNYASRENCKKCGQPKEVAAMPAIAAFPTYPHYFARASSSFGLQQQLPLTSSWPVGGANSWSLPGTQISGLPFTSPVVQPVSVPKGWRSGDWVCRCGFHNYSSRMQCKNCSASVPTAVGTKRLASEDLGNDLENKRLNTGNENEEQQTHSAVDQVGRTSSDPTAGVYAPYPNFSSSVTANWPAMMQFQTIAPALLGKGAKHWRNGDWMCTTCNNHNYASRAQCNKCKTYRDAVAQPVSQVVGAV